MDLGRATSPSEPPKPNVHYTDVSEAAMNLVGRDRDRNEALWKCHRAEP